MKRSFSFILLIALMLSIFSTGFAATVEVGTLFNVTPNFPIAGSRVYSYSQQIYTQAQIGTVGEITKIRFYYMSGNITPSKDWDIYLGHTRKTEFTNDRDWEDPSRLTRVFSGDVSTMLPPPRNWMEITLDAPFAYNNVDNLLIAVHQDTPGGDGMVWGAFGSGENTGMYFASYDTNPDPGNLPTATGRENYINSIQLVFDYDLAPMAPILVTPEDGARVAYGQDLRWTLPLGSEPATGYDVYVDGDLAVFNQSEEYFFLDLDLGQHSWYVMACNDHGISVPSEVRTFEFCDPVVTGEGVGDNFDPFNAFWGYGRSLGLYSFDQIGEHGLITRLGWYNNTFSGDVHIPYKIYAKLTDDTELTPMTWADFTSTATLVKEGSYAFHRPEPHYFALDTPFAYTHGNLLIGVEVNYGGQGGGWNCPSFTYSTGIENSHQRWFPEWGTFDPPMGDGYVDELQPVLHLVFSPLPDEPVLVLDPSEWDFERVPTHASEVKTFQIVNGGGGELNITGLTPLSDGFFEVIDAPSFPLTLGAEQSVYFSIKYAPMAVGNHTATFTIAAGSHTTDFVVSGEGYDPIMSYPYFEGFEVGQTDGTPVQGWTQHRAPNKPELWMANSNQTGTGAPRTGSFNATLSLGGNAWLMRPFLMEAGQSYDVEVWARQDGPNAAESGLALYSGTSGTIAAMTYTIWGGTGLVNGDYQRIRGTFIPNTSGVYWIAIHGVTAYGRAISLDDITVRHSPTDPELIYTPDSINYYTITANTVTEYQDVIVTNDTGGILNLTAADVSIIGTDAAMFEHDSSNLPFALGVDQSGIIPVRYRPTAAGVHSAVLRIVFEGNNYDVALSGSALDEHVLYQSFECEQFPPPGWAVYNGGTPPTWFKSNQSPRTGAAHAQLTEAFGDDFDDWLITPKLAPTDTNHNFSFYASNHFSQSVMRYNIKVSTGNGEISTFTHTLATDVIPAAEYTHYSYDLSAFIGQHIFVAIQATTDHMRFLMIDDVSGPDIVLATAPSPPMLLSPIDSDTMIYPASTFSWNAGPGAVPTGYKLYCDTNNPPTTLVADLTATEYTFGAALLPGTVYYWTVQAYNDEGSGEAATVRSFTTAPHSLVQIGNDTTYNDALHFPAVYCDVREQYIVTAAELNAAGVQAGVIDYIAFNVHHLNGSGSLPNFTIRMGATDLTEFTTGDPITGLDEVLSIDNFTPRVGWNHHHFTLPFFWDGISSVVIETLISEPPRWHVSVYYTDTSPAVRTWVNVQGGSLSSARPNMRLQVREPVGPAAAPVLLSPADGAIDLPLDGFELDWQGNYSSGGIQDYYTVFLARNPATIYEEFSWETTNSHFNPVVEGGMTFAYSERWYWTVGAYNDEGNDVAEPCRSFVTEEDPAIYSYPWIENFDSVAEGEMPEDWTVISSQAAEGDRIWHVSFHYGGSSAPNAAMVQSHHTHDKDEWMITLPFGMQAGQAYKISFALRGTGWGGISEAIAVHWGTEPTVDAMTGNPALYDNNQISYQEWTEESVIFTPPSTGIYYFGWHAYTPADAYYLAVDDIAVSILLDNDLAADDLSGSKFGRVGTAISKTVHVKNEGANPQSNYTVYLKEQGSGAVLAQEVIADVINPGEVKLHPLSWIPNAQGTIDVYAEVNVAGDMYAANDVTAAEQVLIFAEDTQYLYIGNPGSDLAATFCPFNLTYEDYVVETVYLASEIQATQGEIQALVYYNYFPADRNIAVQVWMKNTDANNVNNGWLPWDGYQLVFDGNIDCPAGMNEVMIPITHFNYTGGNLSIRTSRPYGPDWFNNHYWHITEDLNYPSRTRHCYDINQLDHINPPEGEVVDCLPNVLLVMDTENLVHETAAPVVDALISGSDIILEWELVPYAYIYTVYASDDPYTFGSEPSAYVFGNITNLPLTGDKCFYRVTSHTYRDFNRGDVILDRLAQRNFIMIGDERSLIDETKTREWKRP